MVREDPDIEAFLENAGERRNEEDYGEMDYRSDGGGVARLIVTLYGCRICGALKKKCQGDYCGDPQEYLEITDGEGARAKRWYDGNNG